MWIPISATTISRKATWEDFMQMTDLVMKSSSTTELVTITEVLIPIAEITDMRVKTREDQEELRKTLAQVGLILLLKIAIERSQREMKAGIKEGIIMIESREIEMDLIG
jgi:hypothetical protein